VKRLLDLALAVPALAAAAPLIAGLAAAVKLTSPGPAFFVQTRVGRGRRPIRVIKLRTMVADAERRGAQVTGAGDPRITPIGALLRRTKLDELPQLLNVVRGDMSLVGPRPEAPRYVEHYRPEWQQVFDVRPGITDRASLVFRDEEALLAEARDRERAYVEAVMPAKMAVAVADAADGSLSHDLRVLVETAAVVLRLRSLADHPALAEARRAISALDAGTSPHGKAKDDVA
jgi:lipopolysaccharide/colanic/teichoic acid biosynthesis glycosyltransferase